MKLYIGPYRDFYSASWITKFWFKRRYKLSPFLVKESEYDTWDHLVYSIEGIWQTVLNATINKVAQKFDRKIKLKIDEYDVWSMYSTLAIIILPMLKLLKDSKHSAPYINNEDLPPELQMTPRERTVFDTGHYDKTLNASPEEVDAASKKFFAGWDWVLDQMIWSFEQILDENDGYKHYYDPYLDNEPVINKKYSVLKDDGTIEEHSLFMSEDEIRSMGKYNKEKHTAYNEKIQIGLNLFGKHYMSLWS